MILHPPFIISVRLMAAVKVGEATISIEYAKRDGRDGRCRYQWFIDTPEFEESGDDLQSGCGGGSIQEGMESLLSFLSACGESYPDGENADLFPKQVAEWAQQNSDELSMLAMELEENKELIEA